MWKRAMGGVNSENSESQTKTKTDVLTLEDTGYSIVFGEASISTWYVSTCISHGISWPFYDLAQYICDI